LAINLEAGGFLLDIYMITKEEWHVMKLLICLLSVVFLLGVAAKKTRAAAVGYLDVVVNGAVEKEAHPTTAGTGRLTSGEDDLKITMISAGAMLKEKFKVGAEYGFGETAGASGSEDVSLWSVKTGYRLLDKLAFKGDAIVAPLNIDTDNSKLRSFLYGIDVSVYFSKKMFLTGTWVMGEGTYEKDGFQKDDAAPISLLRLKFHYFFNEKIGAIVGYTKLKYESDMVYPAGNINMGRMDVGLGGPVLGLVYKF
jgi:hypothetical protein